MTTANSLVVLDGSSFFVSGPSGDVVPGHNANGYFFGDMRHLSTWRLVVDGEPVRLLSSRTIDSLLSIDPWNPGASPRGQEPDRLGPPGSIHLGRRPRGPPG